MSEHPAAAVLASLRKQLATTTEKLERQALRQRIKDTAARVARAEYRAKAAPVQRERWGAY